MTLSLAALHLMHMCETQSSFLAKSLEVGDYYTLPIRTNEPSISSQLMIVLPSLIVCPPTMTADSTVHKSNQIEISLPSGSMKPSQTCAQIFPGEPAIGQILNPNFVSAH